MVYTKFLNGFLMVFKWFLNGFLNGFAIFKWFLNGFFNGRILVLLIVTSLTSRAACLASDTTSPAAQPVGGSGKRNAHFIVIRSHNCI